MNRLNKTESVVILKSRFFLFLKDPFFQIFWLDVAIECDRCFLNGSVTLFDGEMYQLGYWHVMDRMPLKQKTQSMNLGKRMC